MHRDITISNLLSASRIFLVIPLGYCLVSEFPFHRYWTIGFIIVGVATDFLDGFLARRLHQVTDLGKILDPLADKIAIGVYAVLITWKGDVPLWFVLFVLVRDGVIFLGGIYIHHSKKIIPQSNWPGKIAVTLVAVVLFLGTLHLEVLHHVFIYSMGASVIMMVWSLASYAQRLFIGRNVGMVR